MATVALSSYSVGDSVYLKESNGNVEYIVVHKGIPSTSLYDSSCNGVWLLRKAIYNSQAWNSNNVNNYANSTIHTWLNGTFLGRFSSAVQGLIKDVKIPYCYSSSTAATYTNMTGPNGVSTKVFLLASQEVGSATSGDGSKLDYFLSGTTAGTDAANLRIANYNGSAYNWYLRSAYAGNASYYGKSVRLVGPEGTARYSYEAKGSYGIRPAVIVPASAVVTDGVITGEKISVGMRIGVGGVARAIGAAYVGVPIVTLTNKMPAINGTSGWEATSGSMTSSSTYRKYAATSLGIVGSSSLPESHAATTANYQIQSGRKYYVRYEVYFVSANTRRTTCYWPIAEPNVVNSNSPAISIPANTWKAISAVTNRVADGHSAGSGQLRIDFDHNYSTGTMYVDGVMLIDLTAAFGSGKEPDKAWCDANIPYFTGSKTVMYEGATAKARKIVKGYIGVNGVARLCYEA